MAFPLTYTITKFFAPKSSIYAQKDELFKQISNKIGGDSITIKTEEYKLSFSGPIFRFAWNGFHLLNPISKGSVDLTVHTDGYHLRFKLYFYEMFCIALAFTLIPLALLIEPFYSMLAFLAVWVGFYLSTIILAIYRFDRVMNKILAVYFDKPIQRDIED